MSRLFFKDSRGRYGKSRKRGRKVQTLIECKVTDSRGMKLVTINTCTDKKKEEGESKKKDAIHRVRQTLIKSGELTKKERQNRE